MHPRPTSRVQWLHQQLRAVAVQRPASVELVMDMLQEDPTWRISAKVARGKALNKLEVCALKLSFSLTAFAAYRHHALRSIGKLINQAIGGSKARIEIISDAPGCVLILFRVATDDVHALTSNQLLDHLANPTSKLRRKLQQTWFGPHIQDVLGTTALIDGEQRTVPLFNNLAELNESMASQQVDADKRAAEPLSTSECVGSSF